MRKNIQGFTLLLLHENILLHVLLQPIVRFDFKFTELTDRPVLQQHSRCNSLRTDCVFITLSLPCITNLFNNSSFFSHL